MPTDIFNNTDSINPIDITEDFVNTRGWEYDRINEDQIAMAIEGQWRTYSITIAHSRSDDTLRLVCTYECNPPEDKLPKLYEAINFANDLAWLTHMTYWEEQKLMVLRNARVIDNDETVSPEIINGMICSAVATAERFYPPLQLVCWADKIVKEAMKMAMPDAPTMRPQ